MGVVSHQQKSQKNQAAGWGKKLAKRKEVKALMRVSEFVRKD